MTTMPFRIQDAFNQAERDHGVRILLAIESGSRAWAFPSRDSDWDVRFIYHHPTARYLSIDPPRDVIETQISDALDLGGWDLRKALALMASSNAIILEWLCSPIVYRCNPAARAALATLASGTAWLPALAYHYDRLARRSWPPSVPSAMRLKDIFYALRATAALAWLRRHMAPPPMDLPSLLVGLSLPATVLNAVEQLIVLKREGQEADTGMVPPAVSAFINSTLAEAVERPGGWDRAAAIGQADTVLRGILDCTIR